MSSRCNPLTCQPKPRPMKLSFSILHHNLKSSSLYAMHYTPIMEYACSVWAAHTTQDINRVN